MKKETFLNPIKTRMTCKYKSQMSSCYHNLSHLFILLLAFRIYIIVSYIVVGNVSIIITITDIIMIAATILIASVKRTFSPTTQGKVKSDKVIRFTD